MTFPAHQHRRPAVAPAGARASGGAAARAGFPPPAPEATLDSSRPGGRREPSTAFCPPTPSRRGRQAWASFRLLLVYFLRGRQGGGPDLPVVRDRLRRGTRDSVHLRSFGALMYAALAPFLFSESYDAASPDSPHPATSWGFSLSASSRRAMTPSDCTGPVSYPTRRLRLRLFSPTVMAESRGSLDEQGGGGRAPARRHGFHHRRG